MPNLDREFFEADRERDEVDQGFVWHLVLREPDRRLDSNQLLETGSRAAPKIPASHVGLVGVPGRHDLLPLGVEVEDQHVNVVPG